eukprot:3788546-Alexandrium_andersonii.AAC.1
MLRRVSALILPELLRCFRAQLFRCFRSAGSRVSCSGCSAQGLAVLLRQSGRDERACPADSSSFRTWRA